MMFFQKRCTSYVFNGVVSKRTIINLLNVNHVNLADDMVKVYFDNYENTYKFNSKEDALLCFEKIMHLMERL